MVRALRGRGPRRRDRQAARPALPAGPAIDDQGEARAHRRLRRGRLPLAQAGPGHDAGLAAARPLRRRGQAPPRRHRGAASRSSAARSWSRSWRRCARTRWTGHPWREWAAFADPEAEAGQRMPGATSRWNRGKDLSWEPLRIERVVRGRLRPPAGRSLSPRHAFRPLASRQAARRLPLRPARGAPRRRAGEVVRQRVDALSQTPGRMTPGSDVGVRTDSRASGLGWPVSARAAAAGRLRG